MSRGIVITGVGVISKLGDSITQMMDQISDGKTAFSKYREDDESGSDGRFLEFEAETYLGRKGIRPLNRCTRMLLAAAGLALNDGAFEIESYNEEEIGVVAATNFGVDTSIREMEKTIVTDGADYLSPISAFNSSINAVASQVSIRRKAKAFNITDASGFSAGINSLILAKNLILAGKANAVLVGGCEELSDDLVKEYKQAELLATKSAGMKPFDQYSEGLLLGDGAVVILLEDLDYAKARKAKIYCRVEESFITFYPNNISSSLVTEFLRSNLVASEGGIHDIDLIMSSANGSVADVKEREAIDAIFKPDVKLFNIKTYMGEGFAFSNMLQIALGAYALKNRYIPVCSALDADVPPEPGDLNKVLIHSLGLDGTHGAVIFGKYKEELSC